MAVSKQRLNGNLKSLFPSIRKFGCSCDRCIESEVIANTSVLLVSFDDNDNGILHHSFFDILMGVVDSLFDSPYLSGNKEAAQLVDHFTLAS